MFRFLTWSRILMIYIFISPPSFHYQTQSSLVSPGNEHYVLSHRQSVQSGPLGDVQSTRGLALSSFTRVIVTQSTFLCLFLSLHTISHGATGTNSISCVSHSSIGFLNTYPHGDQALCQCHCWHLYPRICFWHLLLQNEQVDFITWENKLHILHSLCIV